MARSNSVFMGFQLPNRAGGFQKSGGHKVPSSTGIGRGDFRPDSTAIPGTQPSLTQGVTALVWRGLLWSLGVFMLTDGLASSPAAKRPNVLMISVDDMNDWVGCLGSDRVPTPHIDALARRGFLFTNAHAPSPKCAPSRAAILTGRRASTTGLYSNSHWWRPAYPNLVTLPQYFRNHDYYVAGGGKVHHHTPGFNPPDQWDTYAELVADQDLVVDYFKRRGEARRFFTKGMPRHPNNSLDWGPMDLGDMEMGDGNTVRWAKEFLTRNQQKPFFLAVGLFQPHLPFYAPEKYFEGLDQVPLPINKPGDLDDIPPGGQALAALRRNDLRMIEEYDDLRRCMQSYLASIAHADALVGILMDALDKSAHRDNTIVVFWSDHGYAFGEKDHFAKNTLWERSTHVPFILSVPGITKPGSRTHRPVDLTCLYPTLTRLCGLPVPAGLDGVDVTPLLKNPDRPWKHPAIIDFLPGNTAIRTEHWRYIRYDQGRAGEELYYLPDDPEEWRNLIGQFPEKAAELKTWLPRLYATTVPSKGAYRFDRQTYTWTVMDEAASKVSRGDGGDGG